MLKTYRKFTGDRIETHMNGMLEIGRIRYVWFGVTVRWFRSFDFAFQCFFLAIRIFRFWIQRYKKYNIKKIKNLTKQYRSNHLWATVSYPQPHCRFGRQHHGCWLTEPVVLVAYLLRWTSLVVGGLSN